MNRITIILIAFLLLFSCGKKEPTINWEQNIAFSEILKNAGEKLVLIDFIKDG